MKDIEPLEYSTLEELYAKLDRIGGCSFELPDGTVCDVVRRKDGLVYVYFDVLSKEWREETFPSFAEALSLFLVDGRSLMEITGGVVQPPCLPR